MADYSNVKKFEKNSIFVLIREMANLKFVQSCLRIEGGSFEEEIVEQEMSFLFIDKNDIVLELGGNIGRNSLIIASILDNSENLVVFESDPSSAAILTKNRDFNNFHFQIINSALSQKRLIQNGWGTRPIKEDEIIPNGWYYVNTISYSEVLEKTNIPFNVLVCDCEGCLYHILKDEPSFLDHFDKVLLENDFWDAPEQKEFVHDRLLYLGFKVVFHRDLNNHASFWQAWIR